MYSDGESPSIVTGKRPEVTGPEPFGAIRHPSVFSHTLCSRTNRSLPGSLTVPASCPSWCILSIFLSIRRQLPTGHILFQSAISDSLICNTICRLPFVFSEYLQHYFKKIFYLLLSTWQDFFQGPAGQILPASPRSSRRWDREGETVIVYCKLNGALDS